MCFCPGPVNCLSSAEPQTKRPFKCSMFMRQAGNRAWEKGCGPPLGIVHLGPGLTHVPTVHPLDCCGSEPEATVCFSFLHLEGGVTSSQVASSAGKGIRNGEKERIPYLHHLIHRHQKCLGGNNQCSKSSNQNVAFYHYKT